MLGIRRLSALDTYVGGPDVQKLSFLSAPSAKKITHPLCDWLHCGSRTPPSLPHLPLAFLSTFAACSTTTAPPQRAHRVRPHHTTTVVASIAGTTCALSPWTAQPPPLLPSSFSTATAQSGSHCAVLRPPNCYVLLKTHVASVCFE
jgi:hypothetical protein